MLYWLHYFLKIKHHECLGCQFGRYTDQNTSVIICINPSVDRRQLSHAPVSAIACIKQINITRSVFVGISTSCWGAYESIGGSKIIDLRHLAILKRGWLLYFYFWQELDAPPPHLASVISPKEVFHEAGLSATASTWHSQLLLQSQLNGEKPPSGSLSFFISDRQCFFWPPGWRFWFSNSCVLIADFEMHR